MTPPYQLHSLDAPPASPAERHDEPTFERIVADYAPLVRARCQRDLPGGDAQDATQAVFWVLAQRADQAAASPVLIAWLMRVTENVIRNALRDRRRRTRAEGEAGAGSHALVPVGSDLERAELLSHLDRALATLPAAEREALTLHYLAGHSVAQTAALSAAGLSTIKDRLQRGIERLRAQLRAKGYQPSDGALVALLPGLAPPLPHEALRQLLALPGQPSTALPPRIRRWSRQGPSMTTLVSTVIGASLLCGVAALTTLHGADAPARDGDQARSGTAQVLPSAPTPGAQRSNLADLSGDIIPDRAVAYALLRWADGARTAARLTSLPEMALLPDQGAALVREVGSLRSATLLLDTDSLVSRALAVSQHQSEHDMAHLPPQERLRRELALAQAQMAQGMAQAKSGHPLPIDIPALTGSVQLSGPDAPIMAWLRTYLARPQLLGCTVQGHDPQWQLTHGDSSLTIILHGAQLDGSSRSPNAPAAGFPPLSSFPAAPADADLEIQQSLDPGTGTISPVWDISFAITHEGLHFVSTMLPKQRPGLEPDPQPVLDRTAFDRLPSDTLLAGAYALDPASSTRSEMLRTVIANYKMTSTLSPGTPAEQAQRGRLLDHLEAALMQIDGQIMVWVEPGAFLPVVTITADLPKAPSDALITGIGLPVRDDGTLLTQVGMLTLTVGWSHGQLILTSSPDGLAVGADAHGFTQQPEIRRALAALPDRDPQALVLLRPEALVKTLAAFAPLLAPQLGGQMTVYQQRLAAQGAYGYFTLSNDRDGTRMEASGLLAFVAALGLSTQLHMPQGAN